MISICCTSALLYQWFEGVSLTWPLPFAQRQVLSNTGMFFAIYKLEKFDFVNKMKKYSRNKFILLELTYD